MTTNNQRFLAVISVFTLLTAFLWSTQQILSPILVGGFLFFLLMGLKEYPIARRLAIGIVLLLLIWFFVKVQGAIVPILIAFLLAYLFDPLADWLEKQGIRRGLAVFFLLFITLTLLVLVAMILIPNLVDEIRDLINRIYDTAPKIYAYIQSMLPKIQNVLNIDTEKLQQDFLEKIPSSAEQILSNLMKGITGIGAILGQAANLILIPILTFYILKDYDLIRASVLDFIPKKQKNVCTFYLWRMNRILGGYLRGQLTVCVIVGFFTGLGLALFHLPFAILMGFMTGILNIIPYLGLIISLCITLLTSLFTSNPLMAAIKISAIFLIVQSAEAYIIAPKIVGKRVGLHPLAVIFSVLIFSKLLGFWGLFIAVPTAALIKFLVLEWKRRHKWKEKLTEKHGTDN